MTTQENIVLTNVRMLMVDEGAARTATYLIELGHQAGYMPVEWFVDEHGARWVKFTPKGEHGVQRSIPAERIIAVIHG